MQNYTDTLDEAGLIPLEEGVTIMQIYYALRHIRYHLSKRQIEINRITRNLTKAGRELFLAKDGLQQEEKFRDDLQQKHTALLQQLDDIKKRFDEENSRKKSIAFEIPFNLDDSKLNESGNNIMTAYSFPDTPATCKRKPRRSRSLSRKITSLLKPSRRSSSFAFARLQITE